MFFLLSMPTASLAATETRARHARVQLVVGFPVATQCHGCRMEVGWGSGAMEQPQYDAWAKLRGKLISVPFRVYREAAKVLLPQRYLPPVLFLLINLCIHEALVHLDRCF